MATTDEGSAGGDSPMLYAIRLPRSTGDVIVITQVVGYVTRNVRASGEAPAEMEGPTTTESAELFDMLERQAGESSAIYNARALPNGIELGNLTIGFAAGGPVIPPITS